MVRLPMPSVSYSSNARRTASRQIDRLVRKPASASVPAPPAVLPGVLALVLVLMLVLARRF